MLSLGASGVYRFLHGDIGVNLEDIGKLIALILLMISSIKVVVPKPLFGGLRKPRQSTTKQA